LALTAGLTLAGSCGQALPDEGRPAPAGRDAGGAGGANGGAGGANGSGGAAAEPPEPPADDWRRKTIYFALADRFFDGDPSNNALGLAGCFDPAAPLRHHGGDLAGFAAKLDYLRALGAGALWSTPLYRQAGPQGDQCGYHGYWADFRDPDDGAIEPKLGTEADFKALLDALHGAGIAFLLDVVINHTGRGAHLPKVQRPEWFNPDFPACQALGNDDIFCPLSGLPDFDQRRPDVAAYLNGVTASWLTRFEVDGVRLDTAKHVDRAYLLDAWEPAARAARPGRPLFLLAEVFDGSGPEAYRPFLEGGFDSAFNFALRDALLRSFARGESTDAVAASADATQRAFGAERAQRLVTFLDNHDVKRFLSETPPGLPAAERARRLHLALAALFTLPGIPQIYAGTELGAEGESPENRRTMPPWAWTPEGRAGEHPGYVGDAQQTFARVQKLAALRAANPALFAGAYAELWRPNGAADLFAFFRGWGRRSVVVVVNNGAAPAGPIALPFRANPGVAPADLAALPDGTELVDLLGDGAPAALRVEGGTITVALPPKTVGIYRAPN
ncbi:MAG TPA: alpha-amylase family glycosyl hydrolase, partial [Polyangiaceae bacterium]|nr:alpha-amylase family glycosyl hydrolase [Polyangiaceae bacterium]